jgi:hypothetical protein
LEWKQSKAVNRQGAYDSAQTGEFALAFHVRRVVFLLERRVARLAPPIPYGAVAPHVWCNPPPSMYGFLCRNCGVMNV